MTQSELDLYAREIVRWLDDTNCKRSGPGKFEISGFKTVEAIFDHLDLVFSQSTWNTIKKYIVETLHVSLSFVPRRGHFIGWEGEEITNDIYAAKQVEGHLKRVPALKARLNRANAKNKAWINTRFEGYDYTKFGEVIYEIA